jgi:carbonic anhydrase/acetyltransferase-like protein (isoleucine patch superfamily)
MLYAISGRSPEVDPTAWIAPNATILGSVRILGEASVWFGAVVRGDNDLITIGKRSNIQDRCILHTDDGIQLVLGEGVTVGHAAVLHGCTIGAGTLIGIGAIVLNHAKIGAGSMLGAGAFVPEGREIPAGVLAFGSPARVIRDLTEEERAGLRDSTAHYVDKAKRYRAELREVGSEK